MQSNGTSVNAEWGPRARRVASGAVIRVAVKARRSAGWQTRDRPQRDV